MRGEWEDLQYEVGDTTLLGTEQGNEIATFLVVEAGLSLIETEDGRLYEDIYKRQHHWSGPCPSSWRGMYESPEEIRVLHCNVGHLH